MGSVIHRTNYTYKESVHIFDYPSGVWLWNPDLSSVSGVPTEYRMVLGDAVIEMSAAEKLVVDSGNLGLLRKQRYAEIDAATENMIGQGFLYSGKVFSLSEHAQNYWLGMMLGKDLFASGDFPFAINTADDGEIYHIANAAEIPYLYATAMGTVQYHLGYGTIIKDLVRTSTTVSGVLAVVDPRV